MTKIVQVELVTSGPNPSTMTTWLDVRLDVKHNSIIELKELPGVRWLVLNIYGNKELDSKDLDFHRKWDNNDYSKHDGLFKS